MSEKANTPKKAPDAAGPERADRLRKITGVVFILLAIYLGIAFASYFQTWKADQDKVLHFTWASFVETNLVVENWLGRLGAYISNIFFYWGFGLPSVLFVFVFLRLGFDLLQRKNLGPFFTMTRNVIALIAFSSLFFEFVFSSSDFTWGGAFGESTRYWMTNFMGSIGLFFFLFFSIIGYLVWKFNPSAEQMQFALGRSTDLISKPFANLFVSNKSEAAPAKPKKKVKEALPVEDKEPVAEEKTIGIIEREPQDDDEEEMILVSEQSDFEFEPARPNQEKAASAGPKPDLVMEIGGQEPASPSSAFELDNATPKGPIQIEHEVKNEIQVITEARDADDVLNGAPYDPTLDLGSYKYPHLQLLLDYENEGGEVDRAELEANKDQIIETLLNYKIEIVKIRATIGPTVTLYEIVPAPGVKISKIKNLEDDIALSLSALGIRIIAPIPGKGTIGIEVPNKKKQIVSLKDVLMSDKFQNSNMELPIALGKTISNEVFVADLAKMPHLLIAGATGQGKSVGINTILMSLLYKKHPSQVKLVLIDPKKVELFPYASLDQHFLSFLPNEEEPIVTETSKVIYTLNSLCIEMDQRYDLLKAAKARNLQEYNEKFVARRLNPNDGHKYLPYIVLIIDEFADLIMTAGKEVEIPIARLAQLARAIGIHLIIATQRPSVNIITGVIKANFPARLAFKVTSKIDSRTILDAGGAEQLIGRGDMLLNVGSSMVRLQCAFVDTPEVEDVINFISEQPGYPEPFYLPEFKGEDDKSDNKSVSISDLDDMFEEAAKVIVSNQHGSTSMIQRKLQLGYNRAGRIMDQMEKLGIVGPAQGSKPREVLFYTVEELVNFLEALKNR